MRVRMKYDYHMVAAGRRRGRRRSHGTDRVVVLLETLDDRIHVVHVRTVIVLQEIRHLRKNDTQHD